MTQAYRPAFFEAYRPAADLPQTADVDLFVISGFVRIVDWSQRVTTVFGASASVLRFFWDPDTGTSVDLSLTAGTSLSALAAGAFFWAPINSGTAIVQSLNQGVSMSSTGSIPATGGTGYRNGKLRLNASGVQTGQFESFLRWWPLEQGATVTVA